MSCLPTPKTGLVNRMLQEQDSLETKLNCSLLIPLDLFTVPEVQSLPADLMLDALIIKSR